MLKVGVKDQITKKKAAKHDINSLNHSSAYGNSRLAAVLMHRLYC
jgi:hypothetical protein